MSVDETKYWLWLTMVFGTGSRSIWEAMNLFTSAKEAYLRLNSGFDGITLPEKTKKNIQGVTLEQAETFIEQCRGMGIGVAGYSSSEYPPQLRHIYNPPAVLYYKGNIGCLRGTRTVTAVGTRKASEYGLRAASQVCGELARSGFVIVSGFALGIDITTHLAAAQANRPTACVLGCGVDVDYPRGNFHHRDTILENGGVFISEYPPGTSPRPQNFPKRNRILAALGRAAIVFEASAKSGSLITASLALDQGRELFCLPPADIFSSSFSGNIELLRDGATALYSSRDVIDSFRFGSSADMEIRSELNMNLASLIRVSGRTQLIAPAVRREEEQVELPANEQPEVETEEQTAEYSEELTEIQNRIAALLRSGALHADNIAVELGLGAAELMTELTELEILGVVRSLPGKMYQICE